MSARRVFGVARVFPFLFLLACGSEQSTETIEAPGVGAANVAGSASSAPVHPEPEETIPEHINLSEGPVRAGFSVVPQRMFREWVDVLVSMGRHAAAGSHRGVVVVFDVPSGRVRAARRLFRGTVTSLEVSADRKRLFARGASSGGEEFGDQSVVWDLELDQVWRVREDTGYTDLHAMSPDGLHVATVNSGNNQTDVWINPVGEDARHRRLAEDVHADALFFSADSRWLYVFGRDVRRFSVPGVRQRGEPWSLGRHSAIAQRPGTDEVAVVTQTAVQVRALLDGEVKHTIALPRTRAVHWSPDGERIALCAQGRAQINGGEDLATVVDVPVARMGCRSMAFDLRDGDAMASLLYRGDALTYLPVAEGSVGVAFTSNPTPPVVFPQRGAYVLYGHGLDVYIGNITRQRARRLVRGGRGEFSAWSVTPHADHIVLAGRGWRHSFGAGAAPSAEVAEGGESSPSFPETPGDRDFQIIGISPDGTHRLAFDTDDESLHLLNAGESAPIALRPPREGFGVFCGFHGGEDDYDCHAFAEFAPDASGFVVGGERMASFDFTGRRFGTAVLEWVHYTPGGKLLIQKRDGALFLAGRNMRSSGVVFRAREHMRSHVAFSDDGELLAAVRGAALVIYDVEANARLHMIALPARSTTAPMLTQDGLVQVQTASGFIWYSIQDGTEVRRLDLEEVRAINSDHTIAVHCKDGRLRRRALADEGEGTNLGRCPSTMQAVGFDDDRVWWTEGARGHLVRIIDGQHLLVGVYQLRRPFLFAYTPQGHFWASRTEGLDVFQLRAPGPMLDAALGHPTETMIGETLVDDFLAGRPLGEAPAFVSPAE